MTTLPRHLAACALALALVVPAATPSLAQTTSPDPAASAPEVRPAEQVTFLPGASIGVAPLPGMRPSTRFLGFENPQDGTFIALITAPAEEWEAISTRYAPENLPAQGFAEPMREPVEIEGATEAFMVSGEQRLQQSLTVDKWVVAARTPDQTAIVIAQRVPLQPAYTRQAIEAALGTIALREPPGLEDQIGALPFAIGDRAGFRPVRVTGGNSVLFTEGEDNVVEEADQPVVIVAASQEISPPEDRRDDFARRALNGLAGLENIRIERAETFRQDNADWHEAVATATERSGVPVVVQQTIRFLDQGFIRVIAVARAEERDTWAPRFRTLADSLTPR
ncbi:hypothetical protein [Salinarimonas ramus]|uniref:DUF1795 domain-containing protein n=1 Tax=Salinarimonas ramus TaxID=690164 RepID=A0A917Q544_9HYPH|nr:hypothetical protein [Salinarimonas ramus]GGK24246.1 hypothetical protein GCM10011322_08640 [Salinarimonas ramus]